MAQSANPSNTVPAFNANPNAVAGQSAPVYAPPAGVTQPAGGDVFGTSAALYNQAAAGPNIGQFMNPYTNMVTGNALSSLERQRQMATNSMGAQASQAGAFGGSRHGVADALTNEGFARQGAEMFGNLQSQGFNTALNAAQNQQNIQSNLANLGFGFGTQLADKQMQQGVMQQAIQQALIDAAKGQYNQFTGAPAQSLALPVAALGAADMGQKTTTQTQTPGLFNYFSAILGMQ